MTAVFAHRFYIVSTGTSYNFGGFLVLSWASTIVSYKDLAVYAGRQLSFRGLVES